MSRTTMSTSTRRAAIAVAVATALALSACGGGGSGNTVNETPGVALYTNAGSAVSVTHGSVAEYNIGGGDQKFVSYSASSSDTKVATVAVGGTKLKITGVSAGEATVTVTASAGGNVKIAVKVPANALGKLAVNAPAEVTLTPGMSSQYRVTGGGALLGRSQQSERHRGKRWKWRRIHHRRKPGFGLRCRLRRSWRVDHVRCDRHRRWFRRGPRHHRA